MTVFPPDGEPARVATAAAPFRGSYSAWLVAISLNGFFLYLAALDAIGVAPRTRITAIYYAALGALIAIATWRQRSRLRDRLGSGGRVVAVATVGAATLSIWFVLNVAVLSEGKLAHRLAALLVVSTVPTAVLAASLSHRQMQRVAAVTVTLGVVFVLIEALAILRSHGAFVRFSPIAELDAISAARAPAIAAVAAVVLRTADRRMGGLLLVCFTLFTASTVIPGSRGPLVALVVAVVALVAFGGAQWRERLAILACLAVGLGIGFAGASHLGSSGYLESDLGSIGSTGTGSGDAPAISTIAIRRQWLAQAVADIPDRPIFGHGIGMLIDRTPEAKRMGVAGQRIYPHNSTVEAAFSLGLIGLVPYLAFFGGSAWAGVRLIRRGRRGTAALLMVGFGAYGFTEANVSGEIGTDLVAWAAAALALALYADERSAATRARSGPIEGC